MNHNDTPLTATPAAKALETTFLDVRCRILDVAAILDRIGRGEGRTAIDADTRLVKIGKVLAVLQDTGLNKAERIQKIFSLDYDPGWEKPTPRA